MATFSSLEIKNQAGRVATETLVMNSECGNASSNCATMAALIRSAGDDSSATLASDWDSLSNAFKQCGKVINDCGNKMKSALNKYASETQSNETTTASETAQVSDEFNELASYFD